MPILVLDVVFAAPVGVTAGYNDRLHEEIQKHIRVAHKIARRKERKRIAAFRLQSVARGYMVR